ncbi:MAG: hypothetical protein IJY71_07730 [Clostridia bacterium]|nr:hypothetical protein [Clostridia bacterium]
MKNGAYTLFPSMRAIAWREESNLACAKQYFANRTKSGENSFVAFANKHTLFRNKEGNGSYEAIYAANNYDKKREVKLFSFSEKKILTVCVSQEENEAQIREYEHLHHAYGMPTTAPFALIPCAHQISMISLLTRPDDAQALASVADSCKAFNGDIEKLSSLTKEEVLSFDYSDKEMNKALATLKKQIRLAMLPNRFPLCLQHGDLSRDNLLYGTSDGKQGFFWIDWEHKTDRVFFYDFFFYILNSAFCSKVMAPLEAYISGAYDGILTDFFRHFGLEYDPKCKKDYFFLFSIAFLKERVCDLGHTNAAKKYVEFLSALPFSEP